MIDRWCGLLLTLIGLLYTIIVGYLTPQLQNTVLCLFLGCLSGFFHVCNNIWHGYNLAQA
jgi:hypothetical protein